MEIGSAICKARTAAGWNMTRLGYEAGVEAHTVRRWESGQTTIPGPTLELLRVKLPGLREILDAQAATYLAEARQHAA